MSFSRCRFRTEKVRGGCELEVCGCRAGAKKKIQPAQDSNSHLWLGPFNNRVQRSCLVPHCSYPLHWPFINDALRTVTGCLRPTPADNLPIPAGMQPAELRCKGATLSLARRAMEPEHLLQHSALTCPPSGNARRLKSRHPFVPAAQHLISSSDNNLTCGALGASPIKDGVVEQPY